MRFLHATSTVLFLLGAGFFAFDVFCHLLNLALNFFGSTSPPLVEGMMKKLSIEAWWTAASKDNYEIMKSFSIGVIPSDIWDTVVHLPAPTVFIVIALFFYIPWKILSLLGAGKRHEPK